MNLKQKKPLKVFRKTMPTIFPVLSLYVIWGIVSFTIFNVGKVFIRGGAVLDVLIPLTIILFIFLASFLTSVFIVYVNDFLDDNPALRLFLLIITIAIGVTVYYLVTGVGLKNNAVYCMSTANLIVFSCLVATWMTTPVKRPAELVPLCGVVTCADLFSVFAGPSKQFAESVGGYYEKGMQGPPPLVDFFLVKVALPGIDTLMPVFGISDWIIVAFLSAAVTKFGMNDNLAGESAHTMKGRKRISFYFPVASAGLIASVILARVGNLFLPALPFVILFFLAYMLIKYPNVRKLEKKEWVLLVGFSSVMILLLITGLSIK